MKIKGLLIMNKQNTMNNKMRNGMMLKIKKANVILGMMLMALSTGLMAQNYALDFDGSNDYVDCGNGSSIDVTDNFTISAWIYLDDNQTVSWPMIVVKANSHTDGQYVFFVNNYSSSNNKIAFWSSDFTSPDWTVIRGETTIPTNEWTFVTATYSNNTVKFYVNGTPDGEISVTGSIVSDSNNDLNIGRRPNGNYFTGGIDEVSIWNDVRTETEIQEYMCKTLAGNESGLVAYYKMTDGTGTTLTDNSTNSNTGTLTNMDNSDWVTSGAALGDASTYDYSTPSSVNLASTHGDDVTVGTITGSPDGVQIYRVDSAPNVTTPPAGLDQLSQSHYFGVFVVGGSSPTYTLTYNYDGHPGISNENNLDLANRDNNADGTWADLNATINTTNNTLIKTGETGSEYILGSASDNSLPVELTSFTADNSRAGEITLNWVTESEIENLGFILERGAESEDGTTAEWLEIASYITDEALRGQGSVTYRTVYTYTDKSVEPGVTYDYRLADVSYAGEKVYHALNVLGVAVTEIPEEFALFPAYPNPFNPETVIRYQLSADSDVSLQIYDVKGQMIETLLNKTQDPGFYKVNWKPNNLPSGVYFCKLTIGDRASTQKLILLK